MEKKFHSPNADSVTREEQALALLGFRGLVAGRSLLIDIDLMAPRWHFFPRVVWIRYREKRTLVGNSWGWRGGWQGKHEERTTTAGQEKCKSNGIIVYEKFQGRDAMVLILDMLSELGGMGALDAALEKDVSPALNLHYGEQDVPY